MSAELTPQDKTDLEIIRDKIKELELKTGNVTVPTHPHTGNYACPSCGYCPSCGRGGGNFPFRPPQVWY